MIYEKEFFDFQLEFVDKVKQLSGLPSARVLLEYTNLYIRFGLGRDFNPEHPVWQTYLCGLQHTNDVREWTYRFYLMRAEAMIEPPVAAKFGCFSYALLCNDRIRLHFQNAQTGQHSSLAIECFVQRQTELTALFKHVKSTQHVRTQVIGVSWLYNLPSYRRLFPASYVSTARVNNALFHSMTRWGQFLDRNGRIKESMARPFLKRLGQQSSMLHLHECFPFQVLCVESPVQEFYNFYNL